MGVLNSGERRQNDHIFRKIASFGEVFGNLQILVRHMRATINKWGVFGIFTQIYFLLLHPGMYFHFQTLHPMQLYFLVLRSSYQYPNTSLNLNLLRSTSLILDICFVTLHPNIIFSTTSPNTFMLSITYMLCGTDRIDTTDRMDTANVLLVSLDINRVALHS